LDPAALLAAEEYVQPFNALLHRALICHVFFFAYPLRRGLEPVFFFSLSLSLRQYADESFESEEDEDDDEEDEEEDMENGGEGSLEDDDEDEEVAGRQGGYGLENGAHAGSDAETVSENLGSAPASRGSYAYSQSPRVRSAHSNVEVGGAAAQGAQDVGEEPHLLGENGILSPVSNTPDLLMQAITDALTAG
jgi:hypothetical protein